MKTTPVYFYFEILSFLASLLLFFQKGTPRYLKSYPFFLLVTVAVEYAGLLLERNRGHVFWLYNIFAVVTFAFNLNMLRNFIFSKKVRRIILHSIWIHAVLELANLFFIQVNAFNSITFALGCLLVVIFCIYYFFELFRLPRSINLVKEQAFWISCGLLFFHSCSFMFISLTNLILESHDGIFKTLNILLGLIIAAYYFLLTIGFVCRTGIPPNKAKVEKLQ